MTRILLYIDRPLVKGVWYTDPRPSREIMFLVNTGRLHFGLDAVPFDSRTQTAMSLPEQDLVTVAFIPHYVDLPEHLYDIVFGLVDHRPYPEIARQIGASPEQFERLLQEICACFGVRQPADIAHAAHVYGIE